MYVLHGIVSGIQRERERKTQIWIDNIKFFMKPEDDEEVGYYNKYFCFCF